VLFFATGARTPLLALLALRRPRNLAAVALPYAALGLFAIVVNDPAAVLLALAPAPLIAPRLARATGTREDMVGALAIGTVVLSLPVLMVATKGVAASVNMALFAFVFGAAIAGAVPTVRDALLPVTEGARYLAIAVLLGAAAFAGLVGFDPRALGIAVAALGIGTVAAALGARAFGGDPVAAAIGAGLRDPAVAAGLAIGAGLAGAGDVPLAYAVVVALGLGVVRLLVARQS
jgi:hypothetical protein